MTTLHYLFDPLCGWCYAAAPLVRAARNVPGLAIAWHAGGMLVGAHRRAITPAWRDYVMPHDQRIAQLTGQPFGEAYFEGLLRDVGAVMDSEPPTTAMLAAEELQQGRGLDLLHRLQHAHYVEGRRIAELDVLADAAAGLGLEDAAFRESFARLGGAATREHIAAGRSLLAQLGGQGFPTFALHREGGGFMVLDIGRWLGRPDAWAAHLAQLLAAAAASQPAAGGPACGIDGCSA
jgi:putative protein-disulfide isomerase